MNPSASFVPTLRPNPEFCVLHAVAWSAHGSSPGSGDFTMRVRDTLSLVARVALTRDAALLPR